MGLGTRLIRLGTKKKKKTSSCDHQHIMKRKLVLRYRMVLKISYRLSLYSFMVVHSILIDSLIQFPFGLFLTTLFRIISNEMTNNICHRIIQYVFPICNQKVVYHCIYSTRFGFFFLFFLMDLCFL